MLAATAALLYHTLKGKLLGALRLGPSYAFIAVSNPAARGLDQVSALISEGKVKPVVDRVLPLEQAAEAHAYMEQLHARGKVVLKIC